MFSEKVQNSSPMILFLPSGVERPALFRALKSVKASELGRRGWHVLPVGPFGVCGQGQCWVVLWIELGLCFLIFAPLLLSEQLLCLQQDTCVEAQRRTTQIAISTTAALIA